MKSYGVSIYNSKKDESYIASIFLDPKKAYIESILFNLSDLEDAPILETYPNQIKNLLKFYFSDGFNIHDILSFLDMFELSRLIELQEIVYKIQTKKSYYSVSTVV
jgi:spore coat protein CotF